MSRPSRSVYTVTRSTYLPGDDEMSDIAYIDVDDDDDYVDSNLNSTSTSVKPATGNLYEPKRQISDPRDLSERGVFDYFSSPSTLGCSNTNCAEEPRFRPQNHYYLGPGGLSSLQSSGARKFVEAHRQADTTTSSDEEVQGTSYESSQKLSKDDWVRQQYNQHIRQANTQSYDEAVPCDDYVTENRSLSPVSVKHTNSTDFISSRSNMRDNEHVLSRCTDSDVSRDVCDSFERLKSLKDAGAFKDSATLRSVAGNVTCGVDQRSNSPATQSFLLRSVGRHSKDVGDTVSYHLSSSGQSWPNSVRSCESYSVHGPGSLQNASCRSSELSTVVSTVGSVRCSTGVDTGVGFPLSTVSSRSSQGHVDVSRLSSSGQGTVSSGLDNRVHWASNNGLQAIADYHKSYDDASSHFMGRSARYEHLTLRKNGQDSDTYGSRGNDSDGEDGMNDALRNDNDVTSNVEILQRRGKDYDSGSMRSYLSTPQYQLMSTEEEDMERRQSAKGQQLERMKFRRNARLNRQALGVTKADTVPGFRGEKSLEELINYIDTPALTACDAKTAKKSKKKKKKVSVTAASNSDISDQLLANSCEVFVGTSGLSSDEPSIRVGDSCCIELRKKSEDSLPDMASSSLNSPDVDAATESVKEVKNAFVASTVSNVSVDYDVVDSQSSPMNTDTSHLNVRPAEDLAEVAYVQVMNKVLEDENSSESVTASSAGNEMQAVTIELTEVSSEVSSEVNNTAPEVDQLSVVSSSTTDITAENSEAVTSLLPAVVDKQHELDSTFLFLTGSDSVTSDTGSVEDMFVTVQKKKRVKNTAVGAEDPRQRLGRRSSAKGMEDRDTNYYVKRTWVKSSDTTSIVPSVSVSRSSIVYSKTSCPLPQKTSIAGVRYSQASNTETVLSSTFAEKCQEKPFSLAQTVEAEPETTAELSGEPTAKDSACTPLDRNTESVVCGSDKNDDGELNSDFVTPFNDASPADGIFTTDWQVTGPEKLECDDDNKTALCTSSDMAMGSGDAVLRAGNVQEMASFDVPAADKSNEDAVKNDIQIDALGSDMDVSCHPASDLLANVCSSEEIPVKSSQLSIQSISTSDVFLDTRYIAGTTPPRSDISFGFDPCNSPELSDLSLSHNVCSSGATFNAVVASCHCPVVAPMPPPVAACPPVLYFYPAMPMTILPPVATFPTGRCTPVGVVPPMPAVADVTNISLAEPIWQSTDDKVASLPLPQDAEVDGNLAAPDATVLSTLTVLPTSTTSSSSNKPTNEFVLFAAQRYLYSGLPHECLVVHYSSLEALQDH